MQIAYITDVFFGQKYKKCMTRGGICQAYVRMHTGGGSDGPVDADGGHHCREREREAIGRSKELLPAIQPNTEDGRRSCKAQIEEGGGRALYTQGLGAVFRSRRQSSPPKSFAKCPICSAPPHSSCFCDPSAPMDPYGQRSGTCVKVGRAHLRGWRWRWAAWCWSGWGWPWRWRWLHRSQDEVSCRTLCGRQRKQQVGLGDSEPSAHAFTVPSPLASRNGVM